MPDIHVWRRWAALFARRPTEAYDRLRIKVEAILSSRSAGARPFFPELAATAPWERQLQDRLALHWPSSASEEFNELWSRVQGELEPMQPCGSQHDADPVLAHCVWLIVRAMRPSVVVETGVARGLTSRIILEALERNGSGHLWSVDLPPLAEPWRNAGCAAIPSSLQKHWSYIRGSSRRVLDRMLRDCGELDVFVHDSLHTYHHMRFELLAARRHLAPGGVIIADDVDNNQAFVETCHDPALITMSIGHLTKNGAIGAARRVGPYGTSDCTPST